MPDYFEQRFRDTSRTLRIITALFIVVFFLVYTSSAFVTAAKLFQTVFDLDYFTGLLIGAVIVVAYTCLGGFKAVCWTDLFQGLLMFFAIVIIPFAAVKSVGSLDTTIDIVNQTHEGFLNIIPNGENISWFVVITGIGWGAGYFGQPHILVRFMSVKTIKLLPRSITIAMVWVIISLAGAVIIGLLGIPLYKELPSGDEEKVLIYMIRDFVSPYFIGVLLAAILAAIMSTISSQLLVCSSTLTEDIYANVIKPKAGSKELLFVSRVFVLIISLIALVLSFDKSSNIFQLVTFAWGGFGAAFGPVVLMALYSRKTTWYSALAGMVVGTIVMLTWYFTGLNKYMYEIVPGFLANLIIMFIINYIKPNTDKEIDDEYNRVQQYLKDGYTPPNKDGEAGCCN